ncbi:hypothetical protein T02_14239 [Trichinella nativa]|uniref:Uncharacterized protein n=1 Tax=Trichinella nativa TaxID=6335 RepID=A0A0V1L715_9BILA|nr:hypothetical protein T02_14239 [Trichinella nativa]
MRIICTTHNVSEAKITNQLIDTCATYSSVDALLYGQPDGCYLAPGVVRRLTAVCKEPTHFPSGELFEEEINDRQVTHFVYAAACQLGASYRTPANLLCPNNTLLQMSNNRRSNLANEVKNRPCSPTINLADPATLLD